MAFEPTTVLGPQNRNPFSGPASLAAQQSGPLDNKEIKFMKYTIFYSWQSDLPNNTNRGFIESVLRKSIQSIQKSEAYELEPSLDRDTQGIPGSPNITQAIIEKIKLADAFVADISVVTGDKNKEQRLSPNPNVLLELGYAIALLGWEKIILFCNEVYGTDEDLPFDIRQHRRISYKLLPNDMKSETRNNLAEHFKARLIELLQNGKASPPVKQPSLSVSWNYLDIYAEDESSSGIDTQTLEIKRIEENSNLKNEILQEITDIKKLDGSYDPDWHEKVTSFVKKANAFVKELENEAKYKNYLFYINLAKAKPATLSVENSGNTAASDIRIDIEVPNWLLIFEEIPSEDKVPKKPKPPTPVRPSIGRMASQFSSLSSIATINTFDYTPLLKNINVNRTSACYLKNKSIHLWCDKLLHKHGITNRSERMYFIAMPNAPKGKHILKGKAFCSEFEDWQEFEMAINIV